MDGNRGATAGVDRIGQVAAGAGIHGSHKHHPRGIGQGKQGTGDGDPAIFQRLAQDFQHVFFEFRQLVQEKYPVVGQRNFTRLGSRTAADETDVGDRVVGRAEGAHRQQGPFFVEHAADAEDFGGFNRLIEGHARQDGGNTAGDHGLSGTGRTDHQEIMGSSRCHFQGTFGVFLPLYLAEILAVLAAAGKELFQVNAAGVYPFPAGEKIHNLGQSGGTDDL